MKKLRFLSSGVFLIVLAAGLGAGSGASPRPASNSPTPTSPKANSQQLTQDRSAVAAAQKDLDKANDALKPSEWDQLLHDLLA